MARTYGDIALLLLPPPPLLPPLLDLLVAPDLYCSMAVRWGYTRLCQSFSSAVRVLQADHNRVRQQEIAFIMVAVEA